jgi:hypothetical protein
MSSPSLVIAPRRATVTMRREASVKRMKSV